ncbi:hypothetical protein [Thermus antranikianii]
MQKGIATPITLVVLMVVFVSLLAATSYMALGALKGNASERAVFQAFLIAESALDTLEAQAKQDRSILCRALTNYSLAGHTATFTKEVIQESGTRRFRITATATVGGATARVQGVYPYHCPFPLGAPAALTSRPRIEVSGNAEINGQNVSTLNLTRTQGAQTLLNGLTSYSLSVENPSQVPIGSYVRVGAHIFKVAGNQNTLTLLPTSPISSPLSIASGTNVELILYPVLQQSGISGTYSTIALPTTEGLVVNQTISVTIGNQTYTGQIAEINAGSNPKTIRISWQTSPPSNLPEGTPLSVTVLGAASNLTISVQGNAQITNGYQQNSSLVPSNPDDLFHMVFGMDKTTFRALYPGISPSQFNGNLSNWETIVVNQSITSNVVLCGSGILVVFGELKVNGTCDSGFEGLVYVAGDYDQQGNAQIRGAVVVEGVADLQGCKGEDCWTNIAGTGQRQGKITFDPWVMYRLRSGEQASETFQRLRWRRL